MPDFRRAKRFARDRLALLRSLRAAGGPLLTFTVAIQLVGALVPGAVALSTAFLIDRVIAETGIRMFTSALLPLVVTGAVLVLGRMVQDLVEPLNFLVIQRVDGAHRAALLDLVMSARTIDVLERPRVQKLIRRARAEPETSGDRTPGQGATALLAQTVRLAGLAFSCAVLAAFAIWLVPLVLIPALAVWFVWRRQTLARMRLQRFGVIDRIRSDHWKRLATEWTEGKEVRTFGLGSLAVERSQRHLLAMAEPRWRQARRNALGQWKIAAICTPPLALAYVLITWLTLNGHSPVAAQAAVLTSAWAVLQTIGLGNLTDTEASLDGFTALAGLRNELQTAQTPRPTTLNSTDPSPERGPHVRLSGVSFTYPGTDRLVLDGLDLEIRPGEMLALVGLNGAGKSTLVKLLTGLYEPTAGAVLVDGVDLRETDPRQWRSRLAPVFHDFIRFPLSAADNVALGSPGRAATLPELEDAAARAGCRSLIERLPEDWDTPLSRTRPGGTDLSGGQWQQVALARALYSVGGGADLLILDEPTSHLDVRTEFAVFDRLHRRPEGVGALLISHRLSTVREADRIVLLEGGRIAESGTHDELMDLGGRYAELFTVQAARFDQAAQERLEERTGT